MTDHPDSVSGRTVLVADDDPDLLLLMTRRLSKAGYHVIGATDGQQALDLVEQFLPQMAVLDVVMPKLTGIEVLVRLRADPATHNIAIGWSAPTMVRSVGSTAAARQFTKTGNLCGSAAWSPT